jgi:hypothetical protein
MFYFYLFSRTIIVPGKNPSFIDDIDVFFFGGERQSSLYVTTCLVDYDANNTPMACDMSSR